MADIKFNTKYDFGNIGGNKRLTYTSWNDGDYKFDIRSWYDNGNMGKGISLTKTELKSLYDILGALYSEDVTETENVAEDDFFNIDSDDSDSSDDSDDIDDIVYPKDIQKKFDKLDEIFDGYEIEKDYGIMPFAKDKGNRLQYKVLKYDKDVALVEDDLTELGLKNFMTNKGNLYIYSD